jgi:hypothetical protein
VIVTETGHIFVLKSIFGSCIHPYTFATERKALKEVDFMRLFPFQSFESSFLLAET